MCFLSAFDCVRNELLHVLFLFCVSCSPVVPCSVLRAVCFVCTVYCVVCVLCLLCVLCAVCCACAPQLCVIFLNVPCGAAAAVRYLSECAVRARQELSLVDIVPFQPSETRLSITLHSARILLRRNVAALFRTPAATAGAGGSAGGGGARGSLGGGDDVAGAPGGLGGARDVGLASPGSSECACVCVFEGGRRGIGGREGG
jgi:hypothetical protein